MRKTEASSPELPPGAGELRIDEQVGRGASATVYRATWAGRPVALKVGHGLGERRRLAEEAELLALTDTEGTVRLLDAGLLPRDAPVGPGLPYLALEWVDGAPLSPRDVPAHDRTRVALSVARDVGHALAALHAAGVAHGDVKPANVVGGSAGHVLVDLGLADESTRLVPRGGTTRYLAPESFDAGGAGDARSRDLWALGVMLAELADATVATSRDAATTARAVRFDHELEAIVRALLAPAPALRPSSDWVSRRARAALSEVEDPAARAARDRRAVRRTYLAVRRGELLRAARGRQLDVKVTGVAGDWLRQSCRLLERIAGLRGGATSGDRTPLVDLPAFGRSRWLTTLVGVAAARWPVPPVESDSALAERLLSRASELDPRSFSMPDAFASRETSARHEPLDDPWSLAVSLGGASPSNAVLERAERHVAAHPEAAALALALGGALRRRGEIGRALAVLDACPLPDAKVEAAECARRAADPETARARLDAAVGTSLSATGRARSDALRARLTLDAGRPEDALRAASNAGASPAAVEVRALAEVALGRLDAARRSLEEGRALAETDEERARLAGVAGNVLHATGEAARAFAAFVEASDHAVRAGAVLEEATYLTGVAASGFDAGRLGESLEAATRATLLFEHLGRAPDAARALLARAAVFGAARTVPLAIEAAEDAARRARAAGDTRCRAFAHLVLADVLPKDSPDGLEHARRAAALLEAGPEEDRLRAAARRLSRGDSVDAPVFDAMAEGPGIAAPARLDWWGARAERLARDPVPERADRVLAVLSALASMPGPIPSRGEAFAAATRLAARVGDGEAARRFAQAGAEAARLLLEGAPPELRASVVALPWLLELRRPRESSLLPEQLADVEALVRALGTRDRLRPLLDQVLDALLLWTGVERGLLLLRAPEGRLVPRAARNIARHDLRGAQLALSHSLAERALQTGEPVVAVDAAGELPEVHESVHALKLRSVLAVPLVARGEALGVAYLDDRARRGAFGPDELSWVKLVAALAAVAIADARDQLNLRRSARRARRAEARLAATLSTREAELDLAERELARERGARSTRYPYDGILGASAPIRSLLSILDRVTPTEVPVLITGESGSGKELVARAIHANGPRGARPFVSENCGAIPEGLLESALFGHVRGAFTGANRPHAGLFETANGGTLFLDEIGEMSLGMQTKLLRVLEDGEIRPVGSERSKKVDVRVLAATHRDLSSMVDAGTFRRDLFYRLNVIRVDVPPLRARPGDVELLVRHFIAKHGSDRGVRVSREALELLSAFEWPGNIRQLENELRRAIVLADDVIRPEHLSPEVRSGGDGDPARRTGLNVRARVDALEAELVATALERTFGNQTRAAELLGLSRFGLQKMIRRLGIRVPSGPAGRDDAGAVTGER